MKRTFCLAIALFLSIVLRAQGPHSVQAYIGGFNAEYQAANLDDNYASDLYGLYEPHRQIQSGATLTLEYNREILPWLHVGGQFNYAHLYITEWYNMGTRQPRPNQAKNIFSLLPEAKFRIPSPRHFRLYGKVAAGVSVNIGHYNGAPVNFAWDLVPIGCEWGGQRIYGTAELCYGSIIRGGRIGMGFRF